MTAEEFIKENEIIWPSGKGTILVEMAEKALEIKEREFQDKLRELRSCLDICRISEEQLGNAIALKAFETAIKHVDILIPKKG